MSIIQYRRNPLTRTAPMAQLGELHREMSRLFENGIFGDTLTGWAPAMDVTQDKDSILVTLELPGMKKEDISISLQDGVLTVSGERKSENDSGEPQRSERFFGRFERTVDLPVEVDAEKVSARYDNGLLTISLTKAEEAKPKQITINVS